MQTEIKKNTKRHRYAKKLYYFIILVIIFITFFLMYSPKYKINQKYEEIKSNAAQILNKGNSYTKSAAQQSTSRAEIKYILIWTPMYLLPYEEFNKGDSIFSIKSCKWKNCYVTSDRNYLGDYTEFEAILFYGPGLSEIYYYYDIPRKRHLHQKYVFGSVESASYYPVCSDIWNEFFNWTWTYRLNSDFLWAYMVIKNSTGQVIGPSPGIEWMNIYEMNDIDYGLKVSLRSKKRAAAIFISNCNTLSLREKLIKELDQELQKYNLKVDVFGRCGDHTCPQLQMSKCLEELEKHYYFYLAFENSFDEDYVTEKILYALNHNTVPVVYGSANYSRFMPHGIYLDAREMGVRNLAKTMFQLIHNPREYHTFFRWQSHYSYHYRHESPETDDYCRLCALLNDEQYLKKTTVYYDFKKWWSGKDAQCLRNTTNKMM